MTPEQEQAGLNAMHGSFKEADVWRMLQRANVPIAELGTAATTLLERYKSEGIIRYQESSNSWVRVR